MALLFQESGSTMEQRMEDFVLKMIIDRNRTNNVIVRVLDWHVEQIANLLEKKEGKSIDVISYTGDIHEAFIVEFREFVENLKIKNRACDTLSIILSTSGGSVIAVEKMVEITRYHYKEVYFIVPDAAMSAGTIWCMSGDKIYMDYASSLGPIDPQVNQNGKYVPALGYLDKVDEFIKKSKEDRLSPAEFAMMQQLDLAELRAYEQARDLSIKLLEEWLVKYKFKNWDKHQSAGPQQGKEVTPDEKRERAQEIAKKLSSNQIWLSHGRLIGMQTLRDELRLDIDDYTNITDLRMNLLQYFELVSELVTKNNLPFYLHGYIHKERKPDENE